MGVVVRSVWWAVRRLPGGSSTKVVARCAGRGVVETRAALRWLRKRGLVSRRDGGGWDEQVVTPVEERPPAADGVFISKRRRQNDPWHNRHRNTGGSVRIHTSDNRLPPHI